MIAATRAGLAESRPSYSYAGDDPVNGGDPAGTTPCPFLGLPIEEATPPSLGPLVATIGVAAPAPVASPQIAGAGSPVLH